MDWRKLLFPDATDERFADGYAQAVTFGMLMARAKKITLANGLHDVAEELSKTSTLIGAALRLLTDNVETQATLKTALGTLTRVLDAVDWAKISKGKPEAWLYFYEDFLEVYDNRLRKQTGSYYTPPEVVSAMVAMVDEVLRSPRFSLHSGLAAPSVSGDDESRHAGERIFSILAHRSSRRKVQSVERSSARQRRVERMSVRMARSLFAGIGGSVGFVSEAGRFLRLQRVRCDAGTDLDHRA
jgi:hypothetical protein